MPGGHCTAECALQSESSVYDTVGDYTGIAQLTGYNPRKFSDAVVLYSAVKLEETDRG